MALGEAQAGSRGVSEGVFTASSTVALARRHGIEMPIAEAVLAILDQRASVDETIAQLMQRPIKAE